MTKKNDRAEQSSESLLTLLSFIAEPVIAVNAKGIILAANHATEKYTEVKAEAILGKNLFASDFFDEETVSLIKKNLADRLKGIPIAPYEVKLTGKNSRTSMLEINAKKITDKNRNLDLIIFHDVTERSLQQKELEQDLVASEAKFRAITDSAFDGIVVFDYQEKIQYWNAAAQRIFGYKSKEVLGRKLGETIIPNAAQTVAEKIKQDFAVNPKAASCITEINLAKKDGTLLAAEVSLAPLRIDEEDLIIATVRDITERKNVEQLHYALFEQTPLGVLMVDPQTLAIVEFNDVAHEQLGYTRREFQKLKIKDFEANHSLYKINKIAEATLEKGESEFVTTHRTKKGELRTILVNLRRIALSGKFYFLATCHDITTINQLHTELKASEDRFNSIANSVKDALILVDDESKITYWNPAAEKTFGYTAQEAVGKEIHKLVVPKTMCPEGKQRIKESVRTFAETGIGYFTVSNVELIGRRKDGSEFPAELSISPMMSNGKWNAVGVVKDISARKCSDRKLREAELRYHSLFNQAPLGILVIDPDTNACVEFNDVAYLQLGYTREEFEEITIFDIEAVESPQRIREHTKLMVANGKSEFETQHKTKKGEIRNVIVSSRTFQSAGKTYLQCMFHDVTESKKVQNALVESEARYRQLVELAEEGIWAIDNDFVSVFVNPRMAQMLGYTESEMVGKPLGGFLGSRKNEIYDAVRNIEQTGNKKRYEYAFPHKNGGKVETAITLSVITDDQKNRIGTLAVISDITESKNAENAVKESEERFRAISTSALDAIILSDATDRILYWNPAAEKTFGYTAQEVRGKKLSNLVIPKEAQPKHLELMGNLAEGESLSKRHFGFTAKRKDGSSFPMDLAVNTVKLDGKNCLLTIIRDITEWIAMEDALRRERDMLESVAASNNAAITIVGRDFKIQWANHRSREVTYCNDIENKHCYRVFGGIDSPCEGCGVKKVLEEGASIHRRDYHSRQFGQDTWLELIATPIKDKDGKVVAALEVAMEITERKRLQTKLAEYSQKLEELVQMRTEQLKKTQADLVKSERLAAIGELAGMVGHDLRNPLSGIKNSVYYMKKKGPELPVQQAKEMLDVIDRCVNYSNQIINDLLEYSKEIRLHTEEVSPRKLLDESLALMEVPEKVEVINKLCDAPTLRVDSDKIKRVFINLIKNGFDAMPDGGKITVESQVGRNGWEIMFADNGMGISEEVLPKLFLPLFTTKAKGMGFGLAICKRIVEAHGGSIAVSSTKGVGTTFTLNLPFEPKIEAGGENLWISVPEF